MALNNLCFRSWLLVLICLIQGVETFAQDSLHIVDKKRLSILIIGTGVAYSGTMVALGHAWYDDYGKQSFQFFDDSKEWLQVDKVGHFYSAFQLSLVASRSLQWCRVPKKKSDIIGSATGFVLMSSIEVLDGFSSGYGASATDILANAVGSGFYLGQNLLWHEERIFPKFSFHQTEYAAQRPEVLGSGLEEVLKDYNGQTYWLSFDMDKFIRFPKWLNLAVGYGAEEMIYAQTGQNVNAGYSPYRQYYLGIDFDLTAIRTRSKFLRGLLTVVNMVRLPAPALEFSSHGTRFHFFYY